MPHPNSKSTSLILQDGFSLVEVLVALTLLGLASSTLLLVAATTVDASHDATAQLIARGLAEQLIDDVLGQRFQEPGTSAESHPLGREASETSTPLKTILFDDTDDYDRYSVTPPRDRWGIELGAGNGQGGWRSEDFRVRDQYFANWQAEIQITFVDENNPAVDLPASQPSGLRAVRVRVTRIWDGTTQELIVLRRVFAYVPAV